MEQKCTDRWFPYVNVCRDSSCPIHQCQFSETKINEEREDFVSKLKTIQSDIDHIEMKNVPFDEQESWEKEKERLLSILHEQEHECMKKMNR